MTFLYNLYIKWQTFRARLRSTMWGLQWKNFSKQVYILPHCTFDSHTNIEFGRYVFINHNSIFSTPFGMKIGNYVMIGTNCVFASVNHGFSDWKTPMLFQKIENKPIVIKDDVWIGARATILGGVTIGRGSIVAAGAVVTKDVEPYTIVAGVPAKPLKSRFDQATVKKAIKKDFKNFSEKNFFQAWEK